MSPMAYVPIRVSDFAAEGRSLFKGEQLREAALADLHDHGSASLDFTGIRHAEVSAVLVLFLAVREAYPDIHHGSRDSRLGTMAPDPALFLGSAGPEIQEVLDGAWDRTMEWFGTHLAAGTPCGRCGGKGKVVAEHVNHGCGFEDTIYGSCPVCGGVGILA